jgi:hypothetical protein
MITRRTRLTVIGLILLTFILLLVWLVYLLFSGVVEVEVVQETTYEEVIEVPDEPVKATLSEKALETEQNERSASSEVVSLSKTFAERYGSYSNEANFSNLVDVLPLMSASFAQETEQFIESNEPPEEYYGVSTRVITVSVDSQDEVSGTAQVSITSQREESVGSPQNRETKFQDIVLTFITEEGSWKIDSATWQ